MEASVITIVLNGKTVEISGEKSLRGLIEGQGLGAGACAAEVNGKLVPRREHETRVLMEGDRVELVTLVGGGS